MQGGSASRLAAAWARSGLVGMDRSSSSDFWGTHRAATFQPCAKQIPVPRSQISGELLSLEPQGSVGKSAGYRQRPNAHRGPGCLPGLKDLPHSASVQWGENAGPPGSWPAGLAQVQKFPWGYLEYLLNTNLFT